MSTQPTTAQRAPATGAAAPLQRAIEVRRDDNATPLAHPCDRMTPWIPDALDPTHPS